MKESRIPSSINDKQPIETTGNNLAEVGHETQYWRHHDLYPGVDSLVLYCTGIPVIPLPDGRSVFTGLAYQANVDLFAP